jgi:hypothetical protein
LCESHGESFKRAFLKTIVMEREKERERDYPYDFNSYCSKMELTHFCIIK